MGTTVHWAKPFYVSVFSTDPSPRFAYGKSWTTTVEDGDPTPFYGSGFMVKYGTVGVSVGVISKRLQERWIPTSHETDYRTIWTTRPMDETDDDLLEM